MTTAGIKEGKREKERQGERYTRKREKAEAEVKSDGGEAAAKAWICY